MILKVDFTTGTKADLALYDFVFDFAVDKYLNLCLYSRNGNYDKGSEYWFDENTMVNSISLAKVKTLLDK